MDKVRSLATVNSPGDVLRVLGGTLGGDEAKRDAVREKLMGMRGMHAQLTRVEDTAVEMQLARFCLGQQTSTPVTPLRGSLGT
eukprot:6857735-Lingulodinium_polyedra.AAC.1